MTTITKTKGGARVGAGRKPLHPSERVQPLSIRCYRTTITKFRELVGKRGITQRELLEDMIEDEIKRNR